MPKVGDVVLYSLQGRTHNAIVLGLNLGQPDHLGANGEPLLHLLFIAPERESEVSKTKIGYVPSSFIEYDVVHSSQEFSEQYKKNNGLSSPAQIAAARGQGEWREIAIHNIAEILLEPEPAKADRKSRWGKTVTTPKP